MDAKPRPEKQGGPPPGHGPIERAVQQNARLGEQGSALACLNAIACLTHTTPSVKRVSATHELASCNFTKKAGKQEEGKKVRG